MPAPADRKPLGGRRRGSIGVPIAGPGCALLTARWALTATASVFALMLGGLPGVPDQIFATPAQYVHLAAVAAATLCAAVLQWRHS